MLIKDILVGEKYEKVEIGAKPYIEIGDIDINSKSYILKDKGAVKGAKYASKNTILISTVRATRGAITIVNEYKVAVSSAFATIKVDEKKCNYKYLFYLLNKKEFFEYLGSHSKGATYPTCSKEDVYNYKIDLPSLDIQNKVVMIFDKLFENITMKKHQVKLCDEFVKSQFIDMFENKDFPYVQFKEYMERCVDIGSNGANAVVMKHYNMTDTKDFAMVIRFTNLNSGDFENDVKYINKEDYEFYSKSKVYGDEIIFCKIGSAGMNYIMPKLNMPVTLGLNQIMVTPKNINTRYLYEYINSHEGKKYINNNINGAVTKTITKHALWDFPIKTPPIELQNKFAQIVEQIDKQKSEMEKSLKKLEEMQSALMQEYFG